MTKLIMLAPLVLVGCASQPVGQSMSSSMGQTLVVERDVHPMTRGEQIEAMHECRGADFRPRIIYARKLVNGRYTEVVIDVICANKYL
jgi:hypothetical protein